MGKLAGADHARRHHSILAGVGRSEAGNVGLHFQRIGQRVGDRFNKGHAHVAYDPKRARRETIANLFEAAAEEHLLQPTVIYEFPTAISPLSKQKPDEPEWTERFEIYIGQMEISNGFSELNDPEDQRRRFEQQLAGSASEEMTRRTRWTKITSGRCPTACRPREESV